MGGKDWTGTSLRGASRILTLSTFPVAAAQFTSRPPTCGGTIGLQQAPVKPPMHRCRRVAQETTLSGKEKLQ